MGKILSQTHTPVSWTYCGLTTDIFQVTSVLYKCSYFAGSSFIILTWPCHCTPYGVTLAITCDEGVSRGTHIGPPWAHGLLLAGWLQTYIGPMLGQMGLSKGKYVGPCGNLLQVPMDPIIGNPCVAHESVLHWQFTGLIGFCYLELRVGPTWTLVEAKRGPHTAVPMGPSSDSPGAVHESAWHWPFKGPIGYCYLENLSQRWK